MPSGTLYRETVHAYGSNYIFDGQDPPIRASGLDVIEFSMRQRIRHWVDFNFSSDNLADKHYFETQSFLESRVSPVAHHRENSTFELLRQVG